ncbi:hypothetical protein SAMN04489747_0685 [Auraticoccus monumenti]|uniref:CAAX prenyl protease 2/Lysostaphin resistance protein A-like domain-containing protein n=1 Tax=Auraticoccus monumenti TaxID=675864 RepID=A0A1G6TSZ0_9ACTN|nr:hypothetical protein SAMN04489747_0685 [Auraticoccus monumenti]
MGLVVAAALIALLLAATSLIPQDQEILRGLALYAVSALGPLGGFAAAVALRVRDVRAFGLRRVSGRWLLVSVAIGIGVIVLNLLVTAAVVTLFPPPENIQAGYQAAATGGALSFLGALVLGAVLVPIGEELFFRGVLTNGLARYGPWVAVLVSSTVFAVAHGINYVLPVAFVVGVIGALLLRRTGSLWPGVVVHAVNNLSSVIIPAVLAGAV